MQQFRAALSYPNRWPQRRQRRQARSSLPTATLTSAVAQLAAAQPLPTNRQQAAVSAIAKPAKPEAPRPRVAEFVKIRPPTVAEFVKIRQSPAKAPDTKAKSRPSKRPRLRLLRSRPTKVTPDAAQSQLTAAILELESQTASGGTTPADIERQINLRLLYLAAGRRDDAMRPISGMPPDQQQFWTKELYGLATYRDAAKEPDLQRRATEATMHLREAARPARRFGRAGGAKSGVLKEVTSSASTRNSRTTNLPRATRLCYIASWKTSKPARPTGAITRP